MGWGRDGLEINSNGGKEGYITDIWHWHKVREPVWPSGKALGW